MNEAPTPLPPNTRLQRDPLAAIAVPLAPLVLESRYRLLVGALWRLGRSRRGQWVLAAGSGAFVVVLALLVLVLVGIHNEERHMSLTSAPRTRIGAITRHLTGVGEVLVEVERRARGRTRC